jgi:hypothetical protein
MQGTNILVGTKIKPVDLDISSIDQKEFFRRYLHALIAFFQPFKILIKNHKID